MNRQLLAVMAASVLMLLRVPPAFAHQNGQVELWVTNIEFTSTSGGAMFHADVVDRDSGEKASGFAIRMTGVSDAGETLTPVVVTEPGVSAAEGRHGGGHGHYEGAVPLGPGQWQLTVAAEQGGSALPAVGNSRAVEVEIDPTGGVVDTSLGGGEGGNGGLYLGLAAGGVAAAGGGVLVLARRRRPGTEEPAAHAAQPT